MVRLKTKDAAILVRVAHYNELSQTVRLRMLNAAGPTARKIGRIVIGTSREGSPEIKKAAKALKVWAEKNKAFSSNRNDAPAQPLSRMAILGL